MSPIKVNASRPAVELMTSLAMHPIATADGIGFEIEATDGAAVTFWHPDKPNGDVNRAGWVVATVDKGGMQRWAWGIGEAERPHIETPDEYHEELTARQALDYVYESLGFELPKAPTEPDPENRP